MRVFQVESKRHGKYVIVADNYAAFLEQILGSQPMTNKGQQQNQQNPQQQMAGML